MSDPGKSSQRRSILLVASLCLNLLLIGWLAVMLTRTAGGGFIAAQPGGALAPAAIARNVPNEQEKIRGVMDAHQEGVLEARQAAQRARRKAFRVFAAPSYTPAAFAASLNEVRDADSRLEDQAIARLLDTVGTLTPEERQTVITRIRNGVNQPWWRRQLRRLSAQPAAN